VNRDAADAARLSRRRPMRRIGDVLPETAARLGLGDELKLARAMATWERVVAEHVPAASGAARLMGVRDTALLVAADAPIVAQEILLHGDELLAAFSAASGGSRAQEIRIVGGTRPGPGHRPGRAGGVRDKPV
jgi:predicted nucleic acid-binding Zn ribbon protein